MKTKKQLLIIGKNGLIGTSLCRFLESSQVDFLGVGSKECNFLNRDEVVAFFKKLPKKPTQIVFLSALVKHFGLNYQNFEKNTLMTQNLIEGCKHISLTSILFMSSADVFGIAPNPPVDEKTVLNPDNYYGASKMMSEWMIFHPGAFDAKVTALRIPGVYGGPGDFTSFVHLLFHKISYGETITLSNQGLNKRDYIHTQDVNEVILRMIKKPYQGIMNVASGYSHTTLEVAKIMAKSLHKKPKIKISKEKGIRDFDLVFDVSLMKKYSGYHPRSLEEVLMSDSWR